jgi:hypothetical protein
MMAVAPSCAAGGRRLLDPGAAGACRKRFRIPESGFPQAHATYFHWYVQNGTLISVATAFMALVWQGLEAQQGLLSWHSGKFIRACATLAAVFFSAVQVNLAGPLDGATRRAAA